MSRLKLEKVILLMLLEVTCFNEFVENSVSMVSTFTKRPVFILLLNE
jgi:hypothetical protein